MFYSREDIDCEGMTCRLALAALKTIAGVFTWQRKEIRVSRRMNVKSTNSRSRLDEIERREFLLSCPLSRATRA